MNTMKNMLWGIVLIILGLILGLNALDITNIDIFFDGWWTLIIIIPCFIGLFKDKDKTGNVIGLILGFALLFCSLSLLDFEVIWKLAFPVILIIIGLSFVFKDSFNKKITDEINKINKKSVGENEYCATFSSQNVNFNKEEFKGATINSIFGGVKLDLRKAIIKNSQVINCSAIFGGIDIYVPENVNVKIKSNCIFGGISNKKQEFLEEKDVKTIYINATVMFGGVDIK